MIIPCWHIITSSYAAKFMEYIAVQYVVWKYGSLENISFISNVEANQLFKEVFVIFGGISFSLVFSLYAAAVVYVFRHFSFRYYSVKSTNSLSDDVGFAITFCVLVLLYSYTLQIFFDNAWYKFLSVYITQPFILYLLFKNKTYSYSINKRY